MTTPPNWNKNTDACKALFSFAYFQNIERAISDLAQQAATESWGENNWILFNYFVHTYANVADQNKIVYFDDEGGKWACINLGLFTREYLGLYAFFDPNPNQQAKNRFIFHSFQDEYYAQKFLHPLPSRAQYITNMADCLFDVTKNLYIQYQHIINQNKSRLLAAIGATRTEDELQSLLRGAVEKAKIRCLANYRTVVPQYYEKKLQLLLPLSLTTGLDKPQLVLTLTKKTTSDGYIYEAATILSLESAYNNARLIARPEKDWLMAPDKRESSGEN
eukprot:TRINITY_DN1991_c0_g1_i1.p1 TRINITY_DN1991_c0_g1~~TRINITY_DN1991_c0_g1_i1.p1  ORF type:complete len:276 (-),score=8.76 TRINITY_DN1991_c0_g1_i1:93-920(-)